jgi:hypothetical protein
MQIGQWVHVDNFDEPQCIVRIHEDGDMVDIHNTSLGHSTVHASSITEV